MKEKLASQDFYSSSNESSDMDLGKIFRFLLMQSKLILSVVIVVFVLSFTNYSLSTKQYMIQSLVQYEAYDQNVFDPSQSLQLASSSSSSDISNLTTLYESRTNYLKVIKDLNLNIKINDLNDNESIDFKIMQKGQSSCKP